MANVKLEHDPLWFDERHRKAIGDAFENVVRRRRYTAWACAVLQNHAHLCLRTHRDRADDVWHSFAEAATKSLRAFAEVPNNHPIWSHRPYKVFLYTPEDVRGRIKYVEDNPGKHHLPPQVWDFVVPYSKG